MTTTLTSLATCVPGLRQPADECITGGAPCMSALKQLRQAGIRHMVDLRPAAEWSGQDWAAAVKRAGMVFHHLPVDSLLDLDASLTDRLWHLYTDPACQPLFIHCASGNRVGAALALAGWRHGSLEPLQALALGDAAGLGGLRPAVVEALGMGTDLS